MLAAYRSVFRTPLVARVVLTGLPARLPIGMCSLAILLLLRAQSPSFALPGVAVGAYAAANAVASPFQGRMVDRRGRTMVLGTSTVAWAVALLALVVAAHQHDPGWSQVLLAGLVGAAMPPFAAAVRALMGSLIADGPTRDTAYALDAILQETVWIGGPLLVGTAVAVGSATDAVLLTVCVGTLGALGLLVAAPTSKGTGQRSGHWAGALGHPGLRAVVLPMVLVGAGLGATEVGLPALAVHDGHRAAAGALVALWAVGSMIGGLAVAVWRPAEGPLVSRFRVLLVFVALGQAPLILARSVPSAVLLAMVAGLAIAPFFTCLYTLVGRFAPAGTETEAFTWTTTALVGGTALGFAAAGALSATVGLSGPFLLSVAATLAAAAWVWMALPVDAADVVKEPVLRASEERVAA